MRFNHKYCLKLLFLFLPAYSDAIVYYAAITGNDMNPGTPASPFKTITYAYSKLSPGDTLVVKPGTYTDYKPGYGIHLNKSGTPTAPITLLSETKWAAVLDGGAAAPLTYPYYQEAVVYFECNYNIVDGFEIRNGPHEGIAVWGNSNKIIRNNIHHNGKYGDPAYPYGHDGIFEAQYQSGNLYSHNYIHDNGRPVCLGNTWCNLDHGMYLCGDNVIVANNIIANNEANGLQIAGYQTVSSMKVYNNIFVWNNHKAWQAGVLLWQNLDNIIIKNNIFYKNSGYAITSYQAYGSGVVIDKNIFYGNSSGTTILSTADGSGSNFTYTMGTNYTSDPQFVNDTSDFYLQPVSPAIDAGLNLSPDIIDDFSGIPRPQGFAYDIGAYEYVSVTSADEPPSPVLFAIYPNPCSGKFWLSIPSGHLSLSPSPFGDGRGEVEIYNVWGEQVYASPLTPLSSGKGTGGEVIDLSVQPDGIYFIRVRTEEGTTNRKLIIQR